MSTSLRVAVGLLGGIYLVSALSKLPGRARAQFHEFIRALYPNATRIPLLFAVVVGWEVALGLALVIGLGAPPMWLLLSLATLVVFTAALVFGARQPHPVSCACFGPLSRGPVGPVQVLRNVVLIAATGVVGALSADAGWFMAGTAGCALLLAGWAVVAVSSPVADITDPVFMAPISSRLHPPLCVPPVLGSVTGG